MARPMIADQCKWLRKRLTAFGYSPKMERFVEIDEMME